MADINAQFTTPTGLYVSGGGITFAADLTETNVVTGFNGSTGAVTGVTGIVASTGISISGTTRPTITNTGVQTWNGLTGAVSGVTTSVANIFTPLQTFNGGITGTNGYFSRGVTFAGSLNFPTKTYSIFTPLHNQPPATNYATVDTRNSIMVLDFDASTDESAVFVGVIPESASLASGLTIRIHWMATSATSGTCRWGVQIEDMNASDLDSDSFDTAATAGSTTNATSGNLTTTSITITTIDSVVAGDAYRLKVYRDADGTSGTDDMTGDAELVAVEVRSAS